MKICKNGHRFEEAYQECPYCPKTSNEDKTSLSFHQSYDATKISSSSTSDAAATYFSHDDKTKVSGLDKTFVANHEKGALDSRKLVGWLVTFSHNNSGTDFRLYEGRNSIGTDSSNEICIREDKLISAKHLSILFRLGVFKFKDELSTNGTYLNSQFCEEGELHDGDIIKIGATEFIFKSFIV